MPFKKKKTLASIYNFHIFIQLLNQIIYSMHIAQCVSTAVQDLSRHVGMILVSVRSFSTLNRDLNTACGVITFAMGLG